MDKNRNAGRPIKVSGRRDRKIDVRFSRAEFDMVTDLARTLGIKRADLIRDRAIADSKTVLVNAVSLIAELDKIGAELGRSGNNINQLAKYANTLTKQGILSGIVAERFMLLLDYNINLQKELVLLLRRIVRML